MPSPSNPIVLGADIVRFNGRNLRRHLQAQETLRLLVSQAAAQAGLSPGEWKREPTGDGELAVLPASTDPVLIITAFTRALDERLTAHNAHRVPATQLRLRLVLHRGPVDQGPFGLSGAGLITAARLLDSAALRMTTQEKAGTALALFVTEAVRDETAPRLPTEAFDEISVQEHRLHGTFFLVRPPVVEHLESPRRRETPGALPSATRPLAPPLRGEATLQILRRRTKIVFQLLTHDIYYPQVRVPLRRDPDQAIERTIARLGGLASAPNSADAASRLRAAGVNLWEQFVPDPVKEQFWAARDEISSFTILSEDDGVPWELLYPLSPTQDAGFLVEQFPVTRRRHGLRRVPSIPIYPAAFVLPPRTFFSAYQEADRISQRMDGSTDFIKSALDLRRRIDDGSFGLLHFACHNSFDAGGSSIDMADGTLDPSLLSGAVTRRSLAAGSPLVFLNACRSAGAVYEYTRLTGWAEQFLQAGAGAFIGTLWAVPTARANQFAEYFYNAWMDDGLPLGEAAHRARLGIKSTGDPTWLAYAVYGDPSAVADHTSKRRRTP